MKNKFIVVCLAILGCGEAAVVEEDHICLQDYGRYPTQEEIETETARLAQQGISTEDLAQESKSRRDELMLSNKSLGKLEQPLLRWSKYGQSVRDNYRCTTSSHQCIFPAEADLEVRTCQGQFVSEDRKQQIRAAVNDFADQINDLGTQFHIDVNHDNCSDPGNGSVISLRTATTQGSERVFGQHHAGSQIFWPWKFDFYYKRNTIHIDLDKIAAQADLLNKNQTKQLTMIWNVVQHELGHAVGFGHDPDEQVGLPDGPFLLRSYDDNLWNFVGIFHELELWALGVWEW